MPPGNASTQIRRRRRQRRVLAYRRRGALHRHRPALSPGTTPNSPPRLEEQPQSSPCGRARSSASRWRKKAINSSRSDAARKMRPRFDRAARLPHHRFLLLVHFGVRTGLRRFGRSGPSIHPPARRKKKERTRQCLRHRGALSPNADIALGPTDRDENRQAATGSLPARHSSAPVTTTTRSIRRPPPSRAHPLRRHATMPYISALVPTPIVRHAANDPL